MATLTKRQACFVQEYLIDLNATQAAIRAGYSEKGARVRGSELLTNRNVAAAIEKAQQKRLERTEVTQDMVIAELAKLAFSNMMDYITIQADGSAYMNLADLTRDQAAAIQETNSEIYYEQGDEHNVIPVKKSKIKLSDKRGALELLGRHLGLFPNRHELTGKDGKDLDAGVMLTPAQLSPEIWDQQAQYLQSLQNRLTPGSGAKPNGRQP